MSRLPTPGMRLGDYVVRDLLGTGGMGAVFAAEHLELNTRRALKVQGVGAPEKLERFAREARALAKVDTHPGIVTVHEHGLGGPNGQMAYVVMDLVEGPTLAEALKRHWQLPLDQVYQVGEQLAAALAHIHAAGIIHRDLKPGNVLLREGDGQAVLTDFGLARDEAEERLTATGQVLGTLQYMSPEQSTGKRAITPACDVFSLGCLLYEMLCGAPPFTGETYMELVARISSFDPIPIRDQRPDAPRGVADLVQWMLEKDPQARPSAREVADALRLARAGEMIMVGSGGGGSARHWAAVLVVGVALGGVAFALTRPDADAVVSAQGSASPSPTPSETASPKPGPDPGAVRTAARIAAIEAAQRLVGEGVGHDELLRGMRACARGEGDPEHTPELERAARGLLRLILSDVARKTRTGGELVAVFEAGAAMGVRLGRDPALPKFLSFFAARYSQLKSYELGQLFSACVRIDLPMEFMGSDRRWMKTLPASPVTTFLRLRDPTYSVVLARFPPRLKLLKFLNGAGKGLAPLARAHGLTLAAGVADHARSDHLALAAEARRLDPKSPCVQAAWAMALARNGRRDEARAVLREVPTTPMVYESYLFRSLRCWTLAWSGDTEGVKRELAGLSELGAPSGAVELLRTETLAVMRRQQ